jgi:hypothetical protein
MRKGVSILNAPMAAVEQEQFAFKTARQQVAGQRRAHRTGPLAGPDQRHRSRVKQRL